MIEEFKDLKEVQMIVFSLGCEEYAVPIMNVQEIIMPQVPTHIPKAPSWVEGIINLRGHIIPVIDGKKKFSLEKGSHNANNSRIIVLDVEQEIVGLIVDQVSEVVHLNTNDIDPPPVEMGEDNNFLWGIGKHQKKLIILINPQKFLSSAEAGDLKKLASITNSINQNKEKPVSVS